MSVLFLFCVLLVYVVASGYCGDAEIRRLRNRKLRVPEAWCLQRLVSRVLALKTRGSLLTTFSLTKGVVVCLLTIACLIVDGGPAGFSPQPKTLIYFIRLS